MPKIKPFQLFSDEYDQWFVRNRFDYELELSAVRDLLPTEGIVMEVGVGSGMFAAPLGVTLGVEPSNRMVVKAKSKGVQVVMGVAEALPFVDGCVDTVLMVTTICFVDSLEKSLRETMRVLKTKGNVVLGFVDRESLLGLKYLQRKSLSRFYGPATFYSAREVSDALTAAGFSDLVARQTLLGHENGARVVAGTGKGSFVVLRGEKQHLR